MVALKGYSRGDFVSINQISYGRSEANVGRPVCHWAQPATLVGSGGWRGRMAGAAEVTRHQREGNFGSPSFCGLAEWSLTKLPWVLLWLMHIPHFLGTQLRILCLGLWKRCSLSYIFCYAVILGTWSNWSTLYCYGNSYKWLCKHFFCWCSLLSLCCFREI